MADIVFSRTGKVNPNGSIPGTLTIGDSTWPTIERGASFTFVRKGNYELLMTHKVSGRRVKCLCFHEDAAISTHLIHDALGDNHLWLAGCIAPGRSAHRNGIKDSATAMSEVFKALGGFTEWKKCTIEVQNNIRGTETKAEWLARRKRRRTGR